MGVRKNQNRLTAAEKARFIGALKKMKLDTAQPYNYDKYVTDHQNAFAGGMAANPAHNGPAFFPWHRYFILRFERDLVAADTALGNNGNVTLPYWDWTHDDGMPGGQRGSLWRDDFMGGSGDPVASGPLVTPTPPGWPLVPAGPTPSHLKRELGRSSSASSLPTTQQVDDALAIEAYDCPPWDRTSAKPPTAGDPPLPAVGTPPAPTLTGAGGGTLPSGIYRVAVTYLNPRGETQPSREATVCLGNTCTPANTNNAISVASPPASGTASGYQVFVSAAGGAAGTATLQGGVRTIGTATTITAHAPGTAMPKMNSTGSFRNVLEGWVGRSSPNPAIHNRVHVWVGGSLAPSSSPNDPVFFLHHCNIDRLWALWQFRHPGQNYPETVPGGRPQNLNDVMPPFAVRPIDMLNHQTLGYSYDTDPARMRVNVTP